MKFILPNLNNLVISGRLTKDPEVKKLSTDFTVATFTLAVSRKYQKNGEWVDESSFFNVQTSNKLAEKIQKSAKKGSPVIVEGYLKQRSYTNKEGVEIKIIEIIASKVSVLERDEESKNEPKQEQKPSYRQTSQPDYDDENEIPF